MSSYFDDPALPPVRIYLKKKPKPRIPAKHTKDELCAYLRANGINYIVENSGEYQFWGLDNELYHPKKFFEKMLAQIQRQKKENTVTYLGLKDTFGDGFIPSPRNNLINKTRPIDRDMYDKLKSQLYDVEDYYKTWMWLVNRLKFKVDYIPNELLPPDLLKSGSIKRTALLKLSKKENRELNQRIVLIVEEYINQGHSQEKAFHIASANASNDFRKWSKKINLKELTPRTIEGRYKRNKDKIDD